MADSSINVTEGSGKRLQTYDVTVASILVQRQAIILGEQPLASYTFAARAISTATVNDHLLAIMAGSSSFVRIRRIRVEQAANATAATAGEIQIWRLTTAGTGGTTVSASKFDNSDATAGATAQTLPSSKGTEATLMMVRTITFRQALSSTVTNENAFMEWQQHRGMKPLIIPAGTSNGFAIKIATAVAGATVHINVEFAETTWTG